MEISFYGTSCLGTKYFKLSYTHPDKFRDITFIRTILNHSKDELKDYINALRLKAKKIIKKVVLPHIIVDEILLVLFEPDTKYYYYGDPKEYDLVADYSFIVMKWYDTMDMVKLSSLTDDVVIIFRDQQRLAVARWRYELKKQQ